MCDKFHGNFPDEVVEMFGDFDMVGATAPISRAVARQRYDRWIERKHHGQMHYLEAHAPLKFEPWKILPGCRTIIVVGVSYHQPFPPGSISTGRVGRIARYAWGQDYHKVVFKRLKAITERLEALYPRERFHAGVDATPLSEKEYAIQSGIGFMGKNGLVIHPIFGSWFVLGEILTTRQFPVCEIREEPGCPEPCRKCIDVCPTKALYAPYRIDASRCISYLTVECADCIPFDLAEKSRDWLFGCDLCQEVCPYNQKSLYTKETKFLRHRAGPFQDLEALLSIESEGFFRNRYAGTPLMRGKRRKLLRNACIVAVNQKAFFLRPLLEKLSLDSDLVVSSQARFSLELL